MVMLDFVEPASSDVIVKASQTLWPAYAKAIGRQLHLQVSEEVLSTFQSLKSQPLLICPNHSAHEDPAVLFILSTLVAQQFRFLAARESFGAKNTWYAKWLQKIGCYSVERGVADTHAFKATRNLLIQGANKIVVFPEGEVTHQNNYLTEFENGPEHMGLSAQEDLKNNHSEQRVFIVPLALNYKYLTDVRPKLDEAIIGIEAALGCQENSSESLKQRIQKAFSAMLLVLESEHNCSLPTETNFEDRMSALREQLIFETESFLHVELPKDLPQVHKIHILKNKFAEKSWCHEEKPRFVHFRCRQCPTKIERLYYRQLKQATNFLALGNHSFDHDLTQEEAAELLSILQHQVLGKVSLRRPETAFIGAASAIDLDEFSTLYESDRKSGIQAVKLELAQRLKQRLLALEKSQKIFLVT
jgi:hypothetical protein